MMSPGLDFKKLNFLIRQDNVIDLFDNLVFQIAQTLKQNLFCQYGAILIIPTTSDPQFRWLNDVNLGNLSASLNVLSILMRRGVGREIRK